MSRRGDKPSAKIQPLLSGLDEPTAQLLSIESRAYDGSTKPPVLYPPRTLRAPLKPQGEERRIVDHSKYILDKFTYSGNYQRVDDDPLTSNIRDKFRVLIGVRSVYDDIDERSYPFFPAELRRKFPKTRSKSSQSISTLGRNAGSVASIPLLSETVERLAAFSAAQATKRVKTEGGKLAGGDAGGSKSLEELFMMLNSTAEVAAASVGELTERAKEDKKSDDKKKDLEIVVPEGEGESEEEDEEEEEEEEEDSESEGDDYTADYGDDDEEGHDAYGEDDGEAYD